MQSEGCGLGAVGDETVVSGVERVRELRELAEFAPWKCDHKKAGARRRRREGQDWLTAAAVATAAAATTPVTAAPATAVSTTATAAAAFLARASFIDGQGAALEVLAVEHGDGLFCIVIRGHFDEAEAAGAARGTVLHDVNGADGAGLREQVLQVVLGDVEGKVPDEEFSTHMSFRLSF